MFLCSNAKMHIQKGSYAWHYQASGPLCCLNTTRCVKDRQSHISVGWHSNTVSACNLIPALQRYLCSVRSGSLWALWQVWDINALHWLMWWQRQLYWEKLAVLDRLADASVFLSLNQATEEIAENDVLILTSSISPDTPLLLNTTHLKYTEIYSFKSLLLSLNYY